MSGSGIFLEYTGQIDLSVIELLLREIKKTSEFASFDKTQSRRVYGTLVECLENINKHSVLKSSNDKRMQPRITVRKVNDKVIIIAGNPVSYESKDKPACFSIALSSKAKPKFRASFAGTGLSKKIQI